MSGDYQYWCPIHGQYYPNLLTGRTNCPQCTDFITLQPYTQQQFNPMDLTGLKINMNQRKYLPTISDLIDRLTIVQQKELKIPEHREEYTKELEDLMHDLELMFGEDDRFRNERTALASMIRDIIVLTLMNCEIWHNESNFRKGIKDGNNLELTHGLNGIRNTAKNKIQDKFAQDRKDYKVDNVKAFEQWVPSGYKKEEDK